MMRKEDRVIIGLLAVILFSLVFISASFEKSSPAYSLTKKIYGPQGIIEGWIKIKLVNEPADSLLESNFEGKIKLLEFLEKNNAKFTCSPLDCKKGYSAGEIGLTTRTITLQDNSSALIGLKITGNVNRINYLNLSVSSTAPASCNNQLKIDFLDDRTFEKSNEKISTELCGVKEGGCFDSSKTTNNLKLGTTPYCQKLNLTGAPGFNIGAWVKGSGGKVTMKIYNKDGVEKSKCELAGITLTGSEVSCNANYSTKGEEVYVCVSSESGDYQIQGNSNPSSLCGFYGTPIKEKTTAYNIFSQPLKFNSFGTTQIPNNLGTQKLSDMIYDSIKKRYGSLDCSNTCIIPIRLNSSSQQIITISDLKLEYETSSGIIPDSQSYEVSEISSKINSDFIQLSLDKAEFGLKEDYGNKTIKISLNGEEIFSDEITIKKISTINSVYPLTTAAAVPTEFIANITLENNSEIIEYKWEFGDGANLTTEKNKAEHIYNEIKDYQLKITLTDEHDFKAYKIFNISVSSPKNIANTTIKNKENNIGQLKSDIGNFSLFYQKTMSNIINLSKMEDSLNLLRKQYENATTEEDYIKVMKGLISLKIPDFLFASEQLEESSFLQDSEEINIEVLKSITSEAYDSSEESGYITAVNNWFVDNIDAKIIYEEISAEYGEASEPLFRVFTFKITKNSKDSYYIIIKNLENLEFEKDYGEKIKGEYAYIQSDSNEEIKFSTTEEVNFLDVPIFISPSINQLVVAKTDEPICNFNSKCESSRGEDWKNCKDCSRAKIIFISIGGIISAGVIIYIVLYYWYKRKYESHLFKTRNSLYNVVNYINNAKSRGMSEEDIKHNLKKVGWSPEQIAYALRKYKGQVTGMVGFSEFKSR